MSAVPLTRLTKVGFKLAVLGVLDAATTAEQARWWHIVRPGSYAAPDLATRMTYGKSVCGRRVVTNGYAADFTPPEKAYCPACKEQV